MDSCGLIKDLKTRYLKLRYIIRYNGCGLIKDLKTRYSSLKASINPSGCGLIKDLKTRYLVDDVVSIPTVVVWLKIWKHDIQKVKLTG